MKQIKINPSEQRVVVLVDASVEKKTEAGIIIPKNLEGEGGAPEIGTIVSTGEGSADWPMNYRLGDRILCSEYAGTSVDLNLDGEEKEYKVMNQLDIMAKIEEI